MSDDGEADVVEVLSDEYARTILEQTIRRRSTAGSSGSRSAICWSTSRSSIPAATTTRSTARACGRFGSS